MPKSPFDFEASISEVMRPFNGWCACGHVASETFKRAGADSPEEPTRFFLVQAGDICSIYCEPCLTIANHISKMKKLGKM